MPRKRDYKKEYANRIERGLRAGKSRAASRGHPRAEDLGPLPKRPPDRTSAYEKAVKAIRKGASLRAAASDYDLPTERLRCHLKRNTTAQYIGRKWVIFDLRPQGIWMVSKGKMRQVAVAVEDTSDVGRHWVAVSKFLETNDIEHLWPFFGQGVRDVRGSFHPFEIRPNVLRKLDSIGELSFIEIYADVAH